MKGCVNIKFPCGYEFKSELKSGLFVKLKRSVTDYSTQVLNI